MPRNATHAMAEINFDSAASGKRGFRDTWPVGYAWSDASVMFGCRGSVGHTCMSAALFRFIFSKTNPVRKLCHGSCMPRLGHVAGCQVRLRAVQRIAARQVEVGGCKILWVKTPKIRLARSSVRLLKRCSVEG